VIAETIRRAWTLGVGPGESAMTIDVDSTVCQVHGKQKQGAAYGYTKVLGQAGAHFEKGVIIEREEQDQGAAA